MATYLAIKIEDNADANSIKAAGLDKGLLELVKLFKKAIPEKSEVVVLTDQTKTALFSSALAGSVRVLDIKTAGDPPLSAYI